PVCLGMPGVLPVLNKKVVEYALKAGLALNCEIAAFSKFDRKNYYYPDLPKNFQTSQYDLPIAKDGFLEILVDGQVKRIGITRIHMEEDAGKLVHQGDDIAASYSSYVDLNRTGVPLIEIVSEPDLSSGEDVKAYLEKLKAILQYTEISDCKMEEGSLRCDVNLSLKEKGAAQLGTRAEIKNMNSFKAVQRAIEHEIERQSDILAGGGQVIQETRSWDENRGITVSMRSKEEAHDYRYFPEPDLAPMVIDNEWVERVRKTLPEMPDARKKRLVEEHGLPAYDAGVITSSKALSDYFDAVLVKYQDAKTTSNWVMGELLRLLNANAMEVEEVKVKPEQLAGLLILLEKGTVSGKIAKTVFEEMFATGAGADQIVKEKGLVQISDEGAIAAIVQQVIDANPQSVADFISGKEQAVGFLVGQVMKETKGKANPGVVNKLLKEKLDSID
ncbi:MAG: Asp-tRNA(Asn)/Glu-tRNA(Gln) amidotransferase subunit GatB, partial [Clostridia bacterium]|nr:Asp-tRNA(Asn)/Glu-tRNA(Gln) amidotransferase subunit GatB [Clostridia bacterium]